jgi:hypothetical protein
MRSAHWVFGLAVIAACAGTSRNQPSNTAVASVDPDDVPRGEVHKRGASKLIAVVGPSGGTLELANGARLAIPSGALGEPVEITFSEGGHTTAFSNHEYERPIGPTVEIAPEVALNTPVEVSVPLGQLPEGFTPNDLALGLEVLASNQRAVPGQATNTRWDYLEATNKGGRAAATLSSIPGYRVQFVVSKND